MTKVILRGSDEVVGCRNAYPECAEGLAEGKKRRRPQAKQSIPKELNPCPSVY